MCTPFNPTPSHTLFKPITHTLTPAHPHTLTVSPSSSFQESLTLQDIPQFPKSGEERRVERREGGKGEERRVERREGGKDEEIQ